MAAVETETRYGSTGTGDGAVLTCLHLRKAFGRGGPRCMSCPIERDPA